MHHGNFVGHAVNLIPVVGDQYDRLAKSAQGFPQLLFQPEPQMAVQRGERLVQQQNFRFVDQNAGQCNTLLLTAGKLMGALSFSTLQIHCPDDLIDHLVRILFVSDTGSNVLPYGHIREQGILLKQIAYFSLLGRQVDFLLGVKQDSSIQNNPAPIRFLDTCNALERHALAAAGGSQQSQNFIFGLEANL